MKILEKCKIIFYTGIPHAGTTFLFSVLNANPSICTIMLKDEFFEYLSKRKGENGRIAGIQQYYDRLRKISLNIKKKYQTEDVVNELKKVSMYLCSDELYIKYLTMILCDKKEATIKEIVISIFQAKMLCENKNPDINYVPVFIFDAHSRVDAFLKHRKIIELFDEYAFYSSFRNPLYMTASSIKSDYYVSKEIAIRLLKMNELLFLHNIPEEWKNKYYISRFEDEKLYPEKTFRAICKTFKVKYSSNMLLVNETGPTCRGYEIRGFDTEPVTRKLDDIFSEDDEKYLMYIYEDVLIRYHYLENKRFTTFDTKGLFQRADKFLHFISREDFVDALKMVRKEKNDHCDIFYPKLIEKEE